MALFVEFYSYLGSLSNIVWWKFLPKKCCLKFLAEMRCTPPLRKICGLFALNKVNNAPIDWNRSKRARKIKKGLKVVLLDQKYPFLEEMFWGGSGGVPHIFGGKLLADFGDNPLSSHFTEKINQTVFEHSLKTQMWLYDVWCHGQYVRFNCFTVDQVWFGFRPHWAQETEHLWGKQVEENKK